MVGLSLELSKPMEGPLPYVGKSLLENLYSRRLEIFWNNRIG